MDEIELKKLVEMGLSTYRICDLTNRSQGSIKYWLNKFGLKTIHKSFKQINKKDYGNYRICPRCKENCNVEDFYQRRGKKNSSVYCKICTGKQTVERQQKLKKELVNYKGGKCERCDYDKYVGALEFHHRDPSQKDFTISHRKLTKLNEEIKKELDKCILLCANCHREIHNELKIGSVVQLDRIAHF